MSGQAAPGWHYAQGDPPGTVRWWDGEIWASEPIVQPGTIVRPVSDYASWGQRAGATLLDGLIVLGLVIPIVALAAAFLLISETVGIIALVIAYVAAIIMGIYLLSWAQGITGQTPGKRIMGIEVVRDDTGQYMGGGLGLGRYFLSGLNSLPLYLGWLWPLWDAKNQTLVDKILGTVVIKTTRSQKLFPLFPNGKPF